MKTTGTIILPKGTTFDVVAKHLVAFANSKQDVTMKINCEFATAEEKKQAEQDLNILLLEFGEPEFLEHISYIWENDGLEISMQDWDGTLLFDDENILYIRKDCTVSAIKRKCQKDMLVTPVVVQ